MTIAADPERTEDMRVGALDDLANHHAREELSAFLPLLLDEPLVTWALHITLLYSIEKLNLPAPNLTHLRGVDNLDLQAALASLPPRRRKAR